MPSKRAYGTHGYRTVRPSDQPPVASFSVVRVQPMTRIPDPRSLLGSATTAVRRTEATARNATEWLRYGGLATDDESSPYEILGRHRLFKLRRYFADQVPEGVPPLVLVHPVMFTAEV